MIGSGSQVQSIVQGSEIAFPGNWNRSQGCLKVDTTVIAKLKIWIIKML
jgi:hypothetical protein